MIKFFDNQLSLLSFVVFLKITMGENLLFSLNNVILPDNISGYSFILTLINDNQYFCRNSRYFHYFKKL